MSHVTSVRNPGWLFYIGDSTTQVYRDYDKPLFEDLVMNQSVSRWWFQILVLAQETYQLVERS